MKRLLFLIVWLSLIASTAFAGPVQTMMMMDKPWGGGNSQVVYAGTITDLRISAVDGGGTENGGAFIDNAGATIPTLADGNHLIEIYDSANRMIKGVLKAAGAAAEVLANNPAHLATLRLVDDGWTILAGLPTIIDNDSFSTPAANAGILKTTNVLSNKALYKSSYAGSTTAGGSNITDNANTIVLATLNQSDIYKTNPSFGVRVAIWNLTSPGTTDVTSITVQQVLAPSTSGCTIVSQKGGTTWNFTYKNPSFTYNAASYYVIVRAIR